MINNQRYVGSFRFFQKGLFPLTHPPIQLKSCESKERHGVWIRKDEHHGPYIPSIVRVCMPDLRKFIFSSPSWPGIVRLGFSFLTLVQD